MPHSMQGVAKQGKSKFIPQAEQSGYSGRGKASISENRSHLSSVLITAGKVMGVSKDEVVVHLAMLGTACWVVELLPELVTAVAMFGQFEGGKLVTVLVVVDTVGLVTASVITAMLETAELVAAEELVEAVVLVGEVAVELVAALRAWKSAALLLSFNLFFSLFLFIWNDWLGKGGSGWGMR
jgi:hypothetical protein